MSKGNKMSATGDRSIVKSDGPFTVAKGKQIKCRRGTLNPGDIVEPRDFAGGKVSFDEFVSSGKLVVLKLSGKKE